MQIVQESSNLYRLTRFGIINCFLVREEDSSTLIDTNVTGSSEPILLAQKNLGLPIRRILLTHAHFDHVASLDRLLEKLPEADVSVGEREARFLQGDFSLEPNERGKRLFGFLSVKTKVTRKLSDGQRVGSLRAIASPGHTPGHFSYLDIRDGTLIAGDAFTTQTGLVAAGVFSWVFPFPALFSWNPELCARSAAKLRDLKPDRLAVGHGKTLVSPGAAMDRATALAFQQHPDRSTH
jgi:glyoxylase-like metal-dependent hydrolase (beta-lactamase superfamily II)